MSQIRKWVTLPREEIAWLERTYPGASLSQTLAMLLISFRECHAITPEDYAAIGARELRRSIEGD
jgi:hypothetical protein